MGWWNFSYSYSENEYRSTARANNFAFKQTGDNQNHQLRAERVVHRDAVSKTALNVGIVHLRTNNYIEDTRLDASSNRLSEAQFGINHGRRLGRAFVNLDLGIQQGIGAFDAQDNGHPRPGEPVARYRKYSATLSFIQGFELLGERLSFSSLANGQRSEDVLFSSQRISLGAWLRFGGSRTSRCPATAVVTGATICAGVDRSPGLLAADRRRVRHGPGLRLGCDPQ